MKKVGKKTMPILVAGLALFGAAQSVAAASPGDYGNRFMQQGMQGNDISKIQQDLKRLSYFNTNTTGYYGSVTKQAVLDFQRSHGVPDTGNVGTLTKNALASEITKIEGSTSNGNGLLKQGNSNNEVKQLQDNLRKLNYFHVNSTGYFGSVTKSSVIQFQGDKGLSADGIVGPNTKAAIANALNGTSTPSQPSNGNGLLKQGTSNSEVQQLQDNLRKLNYFNANSTGYFGTITKSSVMQFQSDKGLSADGIVGPNTKAAIANALNGTSVNNPSTQVQNPSSSKADAIISTAKKYLGVPYVWGGTSPSGFDCSGFVYYVLRQHGINNLPRVSYDMFNVGTSVNKSDLRAGDLVYFKNTYREGISHVGIYIGDGQFIQASSGDEKVKISNLSGSYYIQHYAGAKRVF
ncbi:C40 family peptidase [Bacillus cereus group sp. TH152-1LC]|uniref:C40 family peptidase n=1 Tax=Bacillus cereus group sp. TH152-1LC TaxID=3018060 RepID=UPI0022DFA645|nr:peptidoglycan-binding protein [Bacillus cereus group sp. TH152-1LC]MDA1675171.1 peptidoglycan-binding protein [Bacillus cereus group sp. TH152-1LC]